jgi:hypothetical protein
MESTKLVQQFKLWQFVLVFLFPFISYAQGGTWVWVRGSDTINPSITYPVQGVADTATNPPALYAPASWTDLDGNFWIFGGSNYYVYGDLWKYNILTNIWTWVKGPGIPSQNSVYGTEGVPSDSTMPGARYKCATWTDANGDLWLFGGEPADLGLNLNDLWKYNIATNQWTWMNGTTEQIEDTNVYGVYRLPSPLNTPCGRLGSSTWVDNNNNLWLFGGAASVSYDFPEFTFNDMWKYNVSTNEWTWMNGPQGATGSYSFGTRGVESLSNLPWTREGAAAWQDSAGNFYMYGGGLMVFQQLYPNLFNDVWKYNPVNNAWTWIAGDSLWDPSGNYGQYCNENSNIRPAAQSYSGSCKPLCKGNNGLIFGGVRYDSLYVDEIWTLNDLWFFDTHKAEWIWASGSTLRNDSGSYGSTGVASPGNLPSARAGHCQWLDNQGTIWIFGGAQLVYQIFFFLNDVWKYIPDTSCMPILQSSNIYAQISKTSICKGDTILLNLTGDVNPQVTPNTAITKLDSVHWLLYPDTTMAYTITGQSYCGNNGSQTFTLNVYTNPHLQVMASDSIFCPGDSVMVAVPYGFLSYLWNNGDTNSYTYAKQAGNYYVTVTDNPTCSGVSDTVGINVFSILPVPVVQSGDTLIASGETAYEWFLNNSLVAAFTRNLHSYVATRPGSYTVLAIDSNGCQTTSLPIIISGIQEIESNRITIYPNPTANMLTGTINSNSQKAIGKIIAPDGQVLMDDIVIQQGRFEIDISALPAGLYFLRVESDGENWVRKFVKE